MTTATADPRLESYLLHHFDLAYGMVLELTAGFDESNYRTAPAPHKPLVWFLGHLTCATDYFSTLHQGTGSAVTPEFSACYAGNDTVDFSDAAPLAEMIALYTFVHERARSFVATLTSHDLVRDTEMTPFGDDRLKNLGMALSIIEMHDAYHCGQIGTLRTAMGMSVPF